MKFYYESKSTAKVQFSSQNGNTYWLLPPLALTCYILYAIFTLSSFNCPSIEGKANDLIYPFVSCQFHREEAADHKGKPLHRASTAPFWLNLNHFNVFLCLDVRMDFLWRALFLFCWLHWKPFTQIWIYITFSLLPATVAASFLLEGERILQFTR